MPLAAAGEATAGVVSPGATAVTDEVLRAMLATKLKIAAAVLLAAGLAGAGVVGAVYGARPGDDPPPAEQPPPRPAKAAPPGADPARPAAARPAEPKTHEEILKDWIYPGSEGPRYDRNAAKRYDYPAKAPIGKVLAFYDELIRKTYDVPEKLKPKLEPGHNGWTRAKAAEYSWVFENTPSGSRDVLDDMPAAVLTLRVPADREGWTVFIRRVNAGNTRVILVYDPPPEPR